MKRLSILGVFLLALGGLTVPAPAQVVTWHPEPEQVLAQKWTWATDQAAGSAYRAGYWIGYAIERRMRESSFIGAWSSRHRRPTLHEVLFGEAPPHRPGDDRGSERMVTKEVAFLFRFAPGSDAPEEVDVMNLSGEVDLEGRPLLWLGGAADAASMDHVQQQYRRTRSGEAKEDLVVAMAMHEDTQRVVDVLSGVLTGDDDDEVREDAAFWLGQRDVPEALDLLVRTARTDRAEDVREQAVFALSQMTLPAATEALIDLARNGDREIREEAIFWLSQEASKRAVETLGEIVEDDPDTEVQKQAVFALSQLPADEGIPLLIEVARTHPRAEVRKQAIFWLGQSEDPRALDALIELVRG